MSSSIRIRNVIGTILRTVAVTAAFAAVVGVMPLRAVFADDDRRGQIHHPDRGRRGNQDSGRREPPRTSRYHRYPVYAPPPAYYPQDESPGIRFIFPIEIR